MKNSFKSQNINIYKTIIISFYLVVLTAILVLFIFVLRPSLELPTSISILISLLFTILGVLGSVYLSVISDLKTTIYKKFDAIKNNIANNTINTPELFSQSISDFIIKTFNFSFFDIEQCIIKIENSQYYFSDETFHDYFINDLSEFDNHSKSNEALKFFGRKVIDKTKYYVYLVPIWFGEEYLGFFAVLAKQKLNKFFKDYIEAFEDEYVDDQLKIVLEKKLLVEQKLMYREIDVYSDKITKSEYSTVEEYCSDILEYFIKKLDCFGGFIKLNKLSSPVVLFEDTFIKKEELVKYYYSKSLPGEQKFFSSPNFGNPYVFQIPIGIDKPYGVIYLFSDSNSLFNYYDTIINGIEDIKLDNDFENLIQIIEANRGVSR